MKIINLNSLVHEIKMNEENLKSLTDSTYESMIIRYCVAKHNETFDMIMNVIQFIEENFSVFDNDKCKWKQRICNNYCFGYSNPHNGVNRVCFGGNEKERCRLYWIDNGIWFRANHDENTVSEVSFMKIPTENFCGKFINHDLQYHDFNYFFKTYSRSNLVNIKWTDIELDDVDNTLEKIKQNVDEDFEKAKKLIEKLAYSLEKINNTINQNIIQTITNII
jgi:hypothetical protein